MNSMTEMDELLEARCQAENERMSRGEKMVAERYGDDLPVITHVVMAIDYAKWDELDDQYQAFKPDFEKHVWRFGSYARMDWAVTQLQKRRVDANTFYRLLPELWVQSESTSGDPRFLKVWRTARRRLGEYVLDDSQFHLPDQELLDVYRGQMNEDGRYGISWTLDYKVALKFAKGAWYRCPMPGIVFVSQVPRHKVLAYLTGRNEAEVILDPKDLLAPQVFARYVRKGG